MLPAERTGREMQKVAVRKGQPPAAGPSADRPDRGADGQDRRAGEDADGEEAALVRQRRQVPARGPVQVVVGNAEARTDVDHERAEAAAGGPRAREHGVAEPVQQQRGREEAAAGAEDVSDVDARPPRRQSSNQSDPCDFSRVSFLCGRR